MQSYRLLAASVCVVLAGCATVREVPVEVKVQVPVPCQVREPEPPAYLFETARPQQPLDDKVKLLLAERRQRQQYENELRDALRRCAQTPLTTVLP